MYWHEVNVSHIKLVLFFLQLFYSHLCNFSVQCNSHINVKHNLFYGRSQCERYVIQQCVHACVCVFVDRGWSHSTEIPGNNERSHALARTLCVDDASTRRHHRAAQNPNAHGHTRAYNIIIITDASGGSSVCVCVLVFVCNDRNICSSCAFARVRFCSEYAGA